MRDDTDWVSSLITTCTMSINSTSRWSLLLVLRLGFIAIMITSVLMYTLYVILAGSPLIIESGSRSRYTVLIGRCPDSRVHHGRRSTCRHWPLLTATIRSAASSDFIVPRSKVYESRLLSRWSRNLEPSSTVCAVSRHRLPVQTKIKCSFLWATFQ